MTKLVTKMQTWALIDIPEERLNQFSNRAIGEALGGQLGQAMVDLANRNLEALMSYTASDAKVPAPDSQPAEPTDPPVVIEDEPDSPEEGEPQP